MKRNKNIVAVNPESIKDLEAQINLIAYCLLGEEDCRELRENTHEFRTIHKIDNHAFPSKEDALVHDLTERVLRLRKMVQAKS